MKLFKTISSCSLLIALILTSGCTTASKDNTSTTLVTNEKVEKQTLSTIWGENLPSITEHVDATRLSKMPFQTTTIYYQSGTPSHTPAKIPRISESPVQISILTENKKIIPLYRNQDEQYQFYGKENERYIIYLHNTSPRKVYEAIITVDGLDVINGQSGSYQNRGYLLRTGDTLFVEGFRKSDQQVAAFRFSTPDEDYVNHNIQNNKKDLGIISVALFESEEGPQKIIRKCSYLPKPFTNNSDDTPEQCIP